MEVINAHGHFLTTETHSAKKPSSWIIHFSVHQGKFPSRELASEFIKS